MKVSQYNLFFPFDGEYILFNTLGGSVFRVDSELKEVLESNELSSLDEECIRVFQDNGIIADDDVDERDQVALMMNRVRHDATTFVAHIIVTFENNVSHTYWKEEGKHMDEEGAACVIEFIKDQAMHNHSTALDLEIMGGEPLLNMPAVLKIARELSAWCRKTDKKLFLKIFTNGTLLTSEHARSLAMYKCEVLVPVKGPQEIHDQRMTYTNGKGTFHDIVEGLHRLTDCNVKTVVIIHIDEENKNHIISLLEFLRDNNLNTVSIAFRPSFREPPTLRCASCIPDEGISQTLMQLADAASAMNFPIDEQKKPFPRCFAHKIHYFTIDPCMRLFKCFTLFPSEKNCVGVIDPHDFKPTFNRLNIDFLSRDPVLMEECRNCKLLPVCYSGCPAHILETEGTVLKPSCNKSAVHEMIQTYLLTSQRKR